MKPLAPAERRTLSSGMTVLYKFVLPALWIPMFAGATALLFAIDSAETRVLRWIFLGATLVGSGLMYAFCMRLKTVVLDGDMLLVSNYLRAVTVPLRDVERVSASIMLNPPQVWVRFRRTTDFGDGIVFTPAGRPPLFGRHPMADELRRMAEEARTRAVGARPRPS